MDGDGFGDDFGADEDEEDDEDAGGFGGADEEDVEPAAAAPSKASAAPAAPAKDSFNAYATAQFTSGAKVTYEHPGLHKALEKPLTDVVGPISIAMAMKLWDQLLVFMGDKPSKDKTNAFAKIHTLCQEGQKAADPLKKEVYCQLLKQLNKNSSKASAARGWILLNMYVPPTTSLVNTHRYLLSSIGSVR